MSPAETRLQKLHAENSTTRSGISHHQPGKACPDHAEAVLVVQKSSVRDTSSKLVVRSSPRSRWPRLDSSRSTTNRFCRCSNLMSSRAYKSSMSAKGSSNSPSRYTAESGKLATISVSRCLNCLAAGQYAPREKNLKVNMKYEIYKSQGAKGQTIQQGLSRSLFPVPDGDFDELVPEQSNQQTAPKASRRVEPALAVPPILSSERTDSAMAASLPNSSWSSRSNGKGVET
ncbi:hypothetical protein J3459_018073 [Metarhizium acridum]|nr:hypothetical protein J3459_018073 [Metarhizium acridum]